MLGRVKLSRVWCTRSRLPERLDVNGTARVIDEPPVCSPGVLAVEEPPAFDVKCGHPDVGAVLPRKSFLPRSQLDVVCHCSFHMSSIDRLAPTNVSRAYGKPNAYFSAPNRIVPKRD